MQEISITDEQLEKWWNEAQENLPEDKRRYTPSYLERREQEIQEKIKKYGVIREPEEKGFLDTLVGFGKKLAAPFLPRKTGKSAELRGSTYTLPELKFDIQKEAIQAGKKILPELKEFGEQFIKGIQTSPFLPQKAVTPLIEHWRDERVIEWGKRLADFVKAQFTGESRESQDEKWEAFEEIDEELREEWKSPAQYAEIAGLIGTAILAGYGATQAARYLTQQYQLKKLGRKISELGKLRRLINRMRYYERFPEQAQKREAEKIAKEANELAKSSFKFLQDFYLKPPPEFEKGAGGYRVPYSLLPESITKYRIPYMISEKPMPVKEYQTKLMEHIERNLANLAQERNLTQTQLEKLVQSMRNITDKLISSSGAGRTIDSIRMGMVSSAVNNILDKTAKTPWLYQEKEAPPPVKKPVKLPEIKLAPKEREKVEEVEELSPSVKAIIKELNLTPEAKGEFAKALREGKEPDYETIAAKSFSRMEMWGWASEEEKQKAWDRTTLEMREAYERIQKAEREKYEEIQEPSEEKVRDMILLMESELMGAEPGRRIVTETGEWIGQPSTYPDWYSDIGAKNKQAVFDAIEKYEKTGKKNALYMRIEDVAKELIETRYESPFFGKVELFAGPGIPSSAREAIWNLVKPDATIIQVEKALNKWQAGQGEAVLRGERMKKYLEGMLEERGISKDRVVFIDKYIEEPEKYVNQVSAKEKEIARFVRETLDKLHQIARENDVEIAYRENYIPHMYKDDPRDVWKRLYPTGGRRAGTQLRQALPRKIPTGDEAEKLGLHPVRDITLKLQVYVTSLYRTLANKKLIDTIKKMQNEEGQPLIFTNPAKAPSYYKTIKEPAFWNYMYVGGEKKPFLVKVPAKAEPRIAKALNDVLDPDYTYPEWLRYLLTAQNTVKRLIMYNPLIHGENIFSDVLDEVNMNFVKAFNVVVRGKVPERLMKELKFKDVEDIDLDMVKHGVSAEAVRGASQEMYEGLRKLNRQQVNKILEPLLTLRDFNDKVLWSGIVASAQRFIYANTTHQLLEKNPEMGVERAKELAAHYTNDLLGTLPQIIFGQPAIFYRIALFARNWTISNLRLLTGATGKLGTAKIIPKALRHAGLTEEEAEQLAPKYRTHLAKGVMGLIFTAVLINSCIKTAKNLAEGKKPSFDNVIWLPWKDAEKGHWLDIDLQVRDKRGRKVYLKNPLFRYMSDYIGWGTEPLQTLQNKMEPIVKQAGEQISGMSWWQKREITQNTGLKEVRDRLLYALRGTTPLGTVYGVTQPETATFEKFIPLTGTWARHGITPELVTRYDSLSRDERGEFLYDVLSDDERREFTELLIKQDYGQKMSEKELKRASDFARKIIEFRRELATRFEDVDKEIDKLILEGKTMEAMDLMESSGRYKTIEGMLDRIQRVRGGMPRR